MLLNSTTRTALHRLLIVALAVVGVGQLHVADGLDNGLARTPPMGWLAWERFVCETNCQLYPDSCISERLFMAQADRLVADGFAALGYKYVNIDDCWSARHRAADRRLTADETRFPSGIRTLANYMHERQLKLGIYGDCGTATCQLFPGQLNKSDSMLGNYFDVDAQSFADWQIDSFKFDACNVNVNKSHELCPLMQNSLNTTGRPMLFSCSWPAYENDAQIETDFALVASKCNLWRAFGDIEDSWSSVLATIDWFVKKQDIVAKYHGPGQWFDADQLVIGDFGLSYDEEAAHMAVWSVWAAPLYMSNDLRTLPKQSSKILRNKWLIDVNQDKHGVFGMMVAGTQELQVFVKPIEPLVSNCPSYAIVYLNRRTLGDAKFASYKLSLLTKSVHTKLTSANAEKFAKWSACADKDATFTANDLLNNNSPLESHFTLDSFLQLRVNPSSARAIKLTRTS